MFTGRKRPIDRERRARPNVYLAQKFGPERVWLKVDALAIVWRMAVLDYKSRDARLRRLALSL